MDRTTQTAILKYTFGFALLVTVLFMILLTIHYTIYPILSFRPGDGGIIPIPTVSDAQIAYKEEIAGQSSPTNFTNMQSCYYTLAMDMYLTGYYKSSPRIVFYRNTSQINTVGDLTVETLKENSAVNYTRVIGQFPNTNFLLWLDPSLNDLYLSVICHSGSSGVIYTSKPIQNVPVRKVFRVGILFTQKFVEIYLNGKLRTTMILPVPPKSVEVASSKFYPSIDNSIKISNVHYWNTLLNPREMEVYGIPIASDTLFTK